jgi:hypothetical protein
VVCAARGIAENRVINPTLVISFPRLLISFSQGLI